MKKDYKISVLLDYYGSLLTEKQHDILTHYYNDDLSLSEIAENEGISRQGVYDTVKRSEEQLKSFEEKIGYYKATEKVKTIISSIRSDLQKAQSGKSDIDDILKSIILKIDEFENQL